MARYPRTMLAGLASTGLLLGLLAGPPLAAGQSVHTYRVTITNLTRGQPLTPPVIATHRGDVNLFRVGQPASSGVQAVAENGAVPALVAELQARPGVSSVVAAGAPYPLVPAGSTSGFAQSVTVTITAGPGAQFLSFESMLICTNDGFTGLNRVHLPNRAGASATYYGDSYDAGTEMNTEDLADIVPPCQGLIGIFDDNGSGGTGMTNPARAEGGVVHHHLGIMGGADLVPAVHGWTGPTSMIEITRLD